METKKLLKELLNMDDDFISMEAKEEVKTVLSQLEGPQQAFRIRQISLHGEHLCDFGIFLEGYDEVKKIAFDEVEKLYPGFKEEVEDNFGHMTGDGVQFPCDRHEFILTVESITVNEFDPSGV